MCGQKQILHQPSLSGCNQHKNIIYIKLLTKTLQQGAGQGNDEPSQVAHWLTVNIATTAVQLNIVSVQKQSEQRGCVLAHKSLQNYRIKQIKKRNRSLTSAYVSKTHKVNRKRRNKQQYQFLKVPAMV